MTPTPARILNPALLALILSNPSPAAEPIPPVLVSATRSEQTTLSVPAAILRLDRAAIAASGARNLSEALRGLAGVQVNDLFGDGSGASLSMRGFGDATNANVLVLVDGRRLNNTDIAPPDLNSINLDDVERIEVVQGSAGTLFGDQAVGGVVNIITRRPRAGAGHVEFGAGSYSTLVQRAGLESRAASGLGFRLSGESRRSDNYRDHNDSDYHGLALRTDYEHLDGVVFAEYQWIDDRLQTPGALFEDEVEADRRQSVADFADDFSNTLTKVLRVGLNQQLSEAWSLEAEATRRSSNRQFVASFRGFAGESSSQRRRVESFNPRLLGSYLLGDREVLVTLGYDLERNDYALASQLGTQDNDQRTRALYAQLVVPVSDSVALTAGARTARVENELRDRPSFGGGISDDADLDDEVFVRELGVSWRPAAQWRLFARLDENYRFVKVDEQTDAGGEILDTQTGLSKELGAEWQAGELAAQVLVYRLDLDDEIVFDPTAGPFGFGANVNLPSTRRRGANLQLSAGLTPTLTVSASLSRIDAEDVSGAGGDRRIPLVAETSWRLAADYRFAPQWLAHAEVHRIGERGFSGDFDGQFPSLEAYTLVNLNLLHERAPWQLGLRVNNLLGEEYSEFGAVGFDALGVRRAAFQPSPERSLLFTAGYRF